MDETCYGGGDIAGAVFGTLFFGIALAFLLWWLYKNYWKNRKGTFNFNLFIFSSQILSFVHFFGFPFFQNVYIHSL